MSNNFLGSTVSNSDISTETTQSAILDKLNAGLTISGSTTTIITDIDTSGGGQTSNLNVSEQNANFANAMLALDTGSIDVNEQNANFANAMLALDAGTVDIGNFPATQNVDITAQTVGNIDVDIAGQTSANLQVQSNNLNLATQATLNDLDAKFSDTTTLKKLKVNNPRKIFSGTFMSSTEPNHWAYNLVSGSGISESWDSTRAKVELQTTSSTAGNFTMASKRKFDCRGLTGFFIVTFSPVLTGLSSSSYVEVGLGGTNSFGTMEMGIRVRGDDAFGDFENQGAVGNSSGGTSGWIYNTTVLGNRAEDEPFTFFFEFAPDVIRCGQIYEGDLRYFTAKYATAPQSFPYTQVWSPLIKVNQDSGDAAFRCDVCSCHLWIDDENKWSGENRSFYTDVTLSYVSGTHYGITGIRYQSNTFREIYVPVDLIGMDFAWFMAIS